MPSICLIQPSGEPIHVDEVKSDRRIDDDYDNAKLRSLISAARTAVESRTRRQLLHARWKYVLDRFPGGSAVALQSAVNMPGYAIALPHSPCVRVVSIDYLDMGGVWQTMPATDYVVNVAMTPAVITPVFGKIWPIPMPQIGSVSVTYDAGYASPIAASGASFKVTGPVTWAVGDRVNFYNSGGDLPTPLSLDATYLVASAVGNVYTITDEAGAPVTFSDSGDGRSFIGVVPDGIRSWMLLRIGALAENREEVAVGPRIVVLELPYIAALLDPYTVIN